jgi:hypothetical protein
MRQREKSIQRGLLSRKRKVCVGWKMGGNQPNFSTIQSDASIIGDRESDIYELFCRAQEIGTHFLVRTCVDRLAGDGSHTIADEMDEDAVKGLHRIEVRDSNGDLDEAVLEIKYRKIRVLPPIGKQNRYPTLSLTVIHAYERGTPKRRQKIEWKLITDLPVQSRQDAIEKLEWYALRWKIEMFHKVLKSGCKAEESRLRTAQRLANLIAVFCVLSWRIFWMTMLNRSDPHASPDLILTEDEIVLLDQRSTRKGQESKVASAENFVAISDQNRSARRLSRPRRRSTARKYGHVARTVTPHRHRIGCRHRGKICG